MKKAILIFIISFLGYLGVLSYLDYAKIKEVEEYVELILDNHNALDKVFNINEIVNVSGYLEGEISRMEMFKYFDDFDDYNIDVETVVQADNSEIIEVVVFSHNTDKVLVFEFIELENKRFELKSISPR